MASSRRKVRVPARGERGPLRWAGFLLFALALVLRLLFWQATPDADSPYSVAFKGDAQTWMGQAAALRDGRTYELDLPLRPPGAAYLLALVWNGRPSGIPAARFVWCVLGALTVPLLFGAARAAFGLRAALLTGLFAAISTRLMVLSASLDNETPYLLLVAASFRLWPRLVARPRTFDLVAWGGVHALACLVRVEHLLVFTASAAVLVWTSRSVRGLAWAAAAFVAVLVPWHVHAWSVVHRLEAEAPEDNPVAAAAQAQVEQALAGLEWTPAARAARERLPAVCRRAAANFVAATVAHRGGTRVDEDDFAILDEAFGARPEPLPRYFFVVVSGGLNLYLAFNPQAEVGFSRAVLDRPPPLAGGAGRYPAALLRGLPPPELALVYPPHLEALSRGGTLARTWILAHPRQAAGLALQRLVPFWDGATLGFGGFDLPFGLSGVRRRADMVVPEAGLVRRAWQLAWLLVAAAGLAAAVRERDRLVALVPWLALFGTKALVSAAFFGYARHGATAAPVVALLAAIAAERWLPGWREPLAGARRRRWMGVVVAIALAAVAVEAGRWASRPVPVLAGRRVTAGDPWPAEVHQDRRLSFE